MFGRESSALLALSFIALLGVPAAAAPSYTDVKTISAPVPLATMPMGTYVGELQGRWQFPSDHLPIAMTFDHLHIVSWNVLDAEYMGWVTEKNSQGLSRSMITDEHVYIVDSKLTIRDQHVANLVLQMISHPTHPRSILALQECSKPFIEELRSRLPAHFNIISNHGDAVLLDQRSLKLVAVKAVAGIFADAPYRTLQDLSIRRLDNGRPLRLVNAHLPSDPTKPGRFEFAQYLADTFDPAMTTLAMGDMNFDEVEMSDAIQQAFQGHFHNFHTAALAPERPDVAVRDESLAVARDEERTAAGGRSRESAACGNYENGPFQNASPFSLYSPYCTNISPYTLNSKAIDHFLVYSPDGLPVALSAPDQIMPGLDPLVSLLQDSNRLASFIPERVD